MSPTTDEPHSVETAKGPRSKTERLADLMAPSLARRALQTGIFTFVFAMLTVISYATRSSLTDSPWDELRSAVKLIFPLYLIAAVIGIVLGVAVAFGAAEPKHRQRGLWAAVLASLSMIVAVVGAAWFGA